MNKGFSFYNAAWILLIFPFLLRILITDVSVSPARSVMLTPTPTLIPARDLDLLPIFDNTMKAEYKDCDLPCWWGFRPGETTITEIISFLQTTGFDRHWKLSSDLSFENYLRAGEQLILDFEESHYILGKNFAISFGFDDNLLSTMHLEFWSPKRWLSSDIDSIALPQVVNHLEEMPEIYIPPLATPSDFPIFLLYDEINTLIVYDFDFSVGRGDPNGPDFNKMCFDIEHTRRIDININDLDVEMTSTDPLYLKKWDLRHSKIFLVLIRKPSSNFSQMNPIVVLSH